VVCAEKRQNLGVAGVLVGAGTTEFGLQPGEQPLLEHLELFLSCVTVRQALVNR
jgi:hypothetical protein